MFPSCLFMIHDSARCGHNNKSELTRGKEVSTITLKIFYLYVISRTDDPAFVKSAVKIYNYLA